MEPVTGTNYLGFLQLGTDCCGVGIFNNNRTQAFIDFAAANCNNGGWPGPALGCGWERDFKFGCMCDDFSADGMGCVLPDPVNGTTDPWQYPGLDISLVKGPGTPAGTQYAGPWFDPNLPTISGGAFGFMVTDFTMSTGYTLTQLSRSGNRGRARQRRQVRVATVKGFVVANSADSTEYFIEWLTQRTKDQTGCGSAGCDGRSIETFVHCCNSDGQSGLRRFRNAGGFNIVDMTQDYKNEHPGTKLGAGCGAYLEMTFEIGDPFSYSPTAIKQCLVDSTWDLGACDPKFEDPCYIQTEEQLIDTYLPRTVGSIELVREDDGTLIVCPIDFQPGDYDPATWQLEVVRTRQKDPDPEETVEPYLVNLTLQSNNLVVYEKVVPERWPGDGSIPCDAEIIANTVTRRPECVAPRYIELVYDPQAAFPYTWNPLNWVHTPGQAIDCGLPNCPIVIDRITYRNGCFDNTDVACVGDPVASPPIAPECPVPEICRQFVTVPNPNGSTCTGIDILANRRWNPPLVSFGLFDAETNAPWPQLSFTVVDPCQGLPSIPVASPDCQWLQTEPAPSAGDAHRFWLSPTTNRAFPMDGYDPTASGMFPPVNGAGLAIEQTLCPDDPVDPTCAEPIPVPAQVSINTSAWTWAPVGGWTVDQFFPNQNDPSVFEVVQNTDPIVVPVLQTVPVAEMLEGCPDGPDGCTPQTLGFAPVTLPTPCWTPPMSQAAQVCTISNLTGGFQYVLNIDIYAGTEMDMRNARLVAWNGFADFPDPLTAPDFWECRSPCAELRLIELPRQSRFVIDDREPSITMTCNGLSRPGQRFIDPQQPWRPPIIECTSVLYVAMYVDCATTSTDATLTVSAIPRGRS